MKLWNEHSEMEKSAWSTQLSWTTLRWETAQCLLQVMIKHSKSLKLKILLNHLEIRIYNIKNHWSTKFLVVRTIWCIKSQLLTKLKVMMVIRMFSVKNQRKWKEICLLFLRSLPIKINLFSMTRTLGKLKHLMGEIK